VCRQTDGRTSRNADDHYDDDVNSGPATVDSWLRPPSLYGAAQLEWPNVSIHSILFIRELLVDGVLCNFLMEHRAER